MRGRDAPKTRRQTKCFTVVWIWVESITMSIDSCRLKSGQMVLSKNQCLVFMFHVESTSDEDVSGETFFGASFIYANVGWLSINFEQNKNSFLRPHHVSLYPSPSLPFVTAKSSPCALRRMFDFIHFPLALEYFFFFLFQPEICISVWFS